MSFADYNSMKRRRACGCTLPGMHARLRLLQQQKPKSASLPGRLIVSGLLCIAATAAHQNKTDRFLEGSLTAVCRAEHFMMLNTSYSLDMPIQLTNGSALLYHRHYFAYSASAL